MDKYAPETCCVVGNYYSITGRHDRAITYFQRALSVHAGCLSAWTLMGHEYMELRNTATAVTCYRQVRAEGCCRHMELVTHVMLNNTPQALNISEQDYRAWYGLGQTYEMLHLYQYASYYYKKAAALKPQDARMWGAVGNCLLKLGLRREAIAMLERAVACGDSEGVSSRELARLCRAEGQASRAAEYYLKYLHTTAVLDPHPFSDGSAFSEVILVALEGSSSSSSSSSSKHQSVGAVQFLDPVPRIDSDQAEGLLFLANHYRVAGNNAMAELFCNR